MDKHFFNIIFNPQENLRLQLAVHNVFSNFQYFLEFNSFDIKSKNLLVDLSMNEGFFLSETFKKIVLEQSFNHESVFIEGPYIKENEQIDYIGTCFYMINSVQEYYAQDYDQLGRFSYEKSYQYKFSCVEDNLVIEYFQEIAKVLWQEEIPLTQSKYFLSHDIDFLQSAWKDEIKSAFKNFDWRALVSIAYRKLRGKDSWQNIEEILILENEFQLKSTFFWLNNQESTSYPKVQNADYQLGKNYAFGMLQKIEKSSRHKNGIHKSISHLTIQEELHNFPLKNITCNRFHYLKMDIKTDYEKLDKSDILLDCSLGFSKHIGFRNSYSLPFKPMNPVTLEQYNFVSLPLNIMDSSLYYFMNLKSTNEQVQYIENFLIKNSQSSIISFCWHNNFFEENAYKNILRLIKKYLVPSKY